MQQLHPVRGKKMLLPPVLTALLGLLALALVGRSLLPLLPAALLLLADALLAGRKLRQQGLSLPASKILLARARATASLGYYLGYHLLRYYLVPLLLISALYPPFGLLVMIALSAWPRSTTRCAARAWPCRSSGAATSANSSPTAAASSGAACA